MEITELQEETRELHWYAIDHEGLVGHFAPGGRGKIPASVKASYEDLLTVDYYVSYRIPFNVQAVVSPNLDTHILFISDEERAGYISCFLDMASRGIFSFDYLVNEKKPTGYFLVALPLEPVHYSLLPEDIRGILGKTKLQGVSFRTFDKIDADQLR